LFEKKGLKAGDKVLVVYYFHQGLDFVSTIHACFYLGIIPVVVSPPDMSRIEMDSRILLDVMARMEVKAILVNSPAEDLFKSKPFATEAKQFIKSGPNAGFTLPEIINTTKFSKSMRVMEESVHDVALSRLAGSQGEKRVAMMQVSPTPDGSSFDCVSLSHDTLIAQCTVFKEMLDLGSTRPILCCAKPYGGLGFLQAAILGIFVGCPTLLLGPVEYLTNPICFFDAVKKYQGAITV
jgi:acyl-CoA synthetase (AMP-forming)/AMP-acid ligase II